MASTITRTGSYDDYDVSSVENFDDGFTYYQAELDRMPLMLNIALMPLDWMCRAVNHTLPVAQQGRTAS
jgi:hypothetical protein